MASLRVQFGGLDLKNPFIVASAPPTETVESILRCAEAGAGAVVTKTIADFDEIKFPLGARRTYVDRRGIWALSTFRRETLTLDAGAALIRGVVAETDMPIIASVGALDMNPETWLSACLAVQDAGAKMIQLDLFYIPQPRCSPERIEQLRTLIEYLNQHVAIPVCPKLNVDIPAHYAAEVLRDMPLGALFLIDSIRVPTPLDIRQGARPLHQFVASAPECSLFGAWQKPMTLQYTRILAERMSTPLCAGGGFMTGADAVEAILLGATTIQFATLIIKYGYGRIGRVLHDIEEYLDRAGVADVNGIRGTALQRPDFPEDNIAFTDVKAVVDHDLCTTCGLCTTQVFCPDIRLSGGRVEVLQHCDGCGLCVSVCPTKPKALTLRSAAELAVELTREV
jgi:dihydroorotate dehydrogenase/Pyruvate/2-oxoacid:ferredoxin oxidoreductase delta subunit